MPGNAVFPLVAALAHRTLSELSTRYSRKSGVIFGGETCQE
jgi:hypothetical protein